MNPAAGARAVDLVVNVFERNYRQVLVPGRVRALAAPHRHPFARRVVLINNVDDPEDARRRARPLVANGELDAVEEVAAHRAPALAACGLDPAELGRVIHYSDCALVAITLPGSPWLLYQDPEVRVEARPPGGVGERAGESGGSGPEASSAAGGWIRQAIELLEEDPRVLVANPRWRPDTLPAETREECGSFALGYGFSDQIFLARREDLARPIYRFRCPASLRYPMSHIAPIFEARLDAYMRTHGRLRATHRETWYDHPPHPPTAARARATPRERLRRARQRLLLRALSWLPVRSPRWRV